MNYVNYSLVDRGRIVALAMIALGGCDSGRQPEAAAEAEPLALAFELADAAVAAPDASVAEDPEWDAIRGETLEELAQISRASRMSTETLEAYTAQCERAVGLVIPDFSCEAGVRVPGQDIEEPGRCRTPNVLNSECDPGSKFQVLARSEDAAAVAHCRKTGLEEGKYSDIAVIAYNKRNGAVCFFQALGYLDGTAVPAPSKGSGLWREGDDWSQWYTPQQTADVGCTGCHDSGGFIRSPYLAQLGLLPSTAEGFTNGKHLPLRFVGDAFADDRSWHVEVDPPPCPEGEVCLQCTTCHTLAVNNRRPGQGTAMALAKIATADEQEAKLPHSQYSPIWMRPGQVRYSEEAAQSAKRYYDCAKSFLEGKPEEAPPGCTVTPHGIPWTE